MIRHVCALAGLLALFLQGSRGGHMLLVEHTRCAEHGDLVHEGVAHHHGASDHTESDKAAFESVSDEGSDEAHEHCALTADRRDAFLVVDSHAPPCLLEVPRSVASADAFVPADTRRFRIAPKNSPPA